MPKGKFTSQESAYAVRAIRATLEVQLWSTADLNKFVNRYYFSFEYNLSEKTQALLKAAKIEQTRRS